MSDEIWMFRESDGSPSPSYTSAAVVAKYAVMHGAHGLPTRPATREEMAAEEAMHLAAHQHDGSMNYDAPAAVEAWERLRALMLTGWGAA